MYLTWHSNPMKKTHHAMSVVAHIHEIWMPWTYDILKYFVSRPDETNFLNFDQLCKTNLFEYLLTIALRIIYFTSFLGLDTLQKGNSFDFYFSNNWLFFIEICSEVRAQWSEILAVELVKWHSSMIYIFPYTRYSPLPDSSLIIRI